MAQSEENHACVYTNTPKRLNSNVQHKSSVTSAIYFANASVAAKHTSMWNMKIHQRTQPCVHICIVNTYILGAYTTMLYLVLT